MGVEEGARVGAANDGGRQSGSEEELGDRLTFFWPRHGSIRKPSGGHRI